MYTSVVIPTRNRTTYVRDLLKDLEEQSLRDFEVIVVDQSEIPVKFNNCLQIETTTKGPCISRNIGAAQAKGEILVFLDDDARINSNFLYELTKPIIEGKSVAVAGEVCDIHGNHTKEQVDFLKSSTNNFIKALTNNPNFNESRYTLSFPGGCSAILKTVFEEIGGFDEDLDPSGAAEDRDMALNLFKHGYIIWYTCEAKLLHIGAAEGGSRDHGSRSEIIDIHTYRICKKYFSEQLSDELKRSILNKYKKKFFQTFRGFNGFRSRRQQYLRIKRLLN